MPSQKEPQREIEGRQQAEQALRVSHEERFRLLVQGVKDYAIYMLDPRGHVTTWNIGAERIMGYRAEEIIGQYVSCFYPKEAVEQGLPEKELEAATRGGCFEDECWRVRKVGSRFWAHVVITALKDEAGSLKGFSKITHDLTKQQEAEENLRQWEEKQKQAEEALKEANCRKDQFLAMLAHELRNPLASVRTGLHILRMPNGDRAAANRVMEVMDEQVRHLTRLVDDLLDVSRITRGKIELRREIIDLCAAVGKAVETSRPFLETQRHQLTVSLPPAPVHLEADPTRLEQVLCNLLNNAGKYTDQGGHIDLDVAREGEEVLVHVRDTGIGIPADFLPHIFDLFTQADRALERSQGGLGVGLTMARKLVEMMGGSVTAHSDGPGKGSEFVVRLPALPEAWAREPDGPSEASRSDNRLLRVLVVEDQPAVSEMLVTLLRLWGHDARAVSEGPAALLVARTYYPDVVLLDIGLPGMNGYEVARQLRVEAGGKRRLIAAITGYGQENDLLRSREAGFDYHMVKPIDPNALGELLTAAGSLRQVPPPPDAKLSAN